MMWPWADETLTIDDITRFGGDKNDVQGLLLRSRMSYGADLRGAGK